MQEYQLAMFLELIWMLLRADRTRARSWCSWRPLLSLLISSQMTAISSLRHSVNQWPWSLGSWGAGVWLDDHQLCLDWRITLVPAAEQWAWARYLCPSRHTLLPKMFPPREKPPPAMGEKALSPSPVTCIVFMFIYWLLLKSRIFSSWKTAL